MKLSRQSGFSHIEALISVALVAVSTVAIALIFQNSIKGLLHSEIKVKEVEMMHNLRLNLLSQVTCDKNFKYKVFQGNGSMNVSRIEDLSDSSLLAVGERIANNKVEILSIDFTVPKSTWEAFQIAKSSLPADGYFVNSELIIQLRRVASAVGANTTQMTVTVPTKIDAAGSILGCFTMESALDDLALQTSCVQLGGEFDTATSKCVFNMDCNSLNSATPVDGKCVIEKIKQVSADIDTLTSQITTLTQPTKTLRSSILNCLKNSRNLTIGKDSVKCVVGSGNIYSLESTPTSFGADQLMNHVDITKAEEAKQLYQFVRDSLTGTTENLLDGDLGAE